jgi:DNA-binding NarL/FixJ family response regulator
MATEHRAKLGVLLVAEDPLVRSGLAHALAREQGVVVTGEASPGEQDAVLAASGADVILRDLGPGTAGDDASLPPRPRVPVLALVADESRAADALAAGARGVLLRSADGPRIAAALAACALGVVAIDEGLAPGLLDRPRIVPAAGRDKLTPRELEVLDLLARGLANKEIAHRLGVSEHTAKFHVNSILEKLGAESRTQAVVRAVQLGLVAL